MNVKSKINRDSMELINPSNFHKKLAGRQIDLYTISNKNGLTAQITNFGGRVVSLWVPDQDGLFADIVLGFNHINDYLNADEIYFGALIGRYGNRIANGKFTLNGKAYNLASNNGKNHLHGGTIGFNNVVWDTDQISESTLVLNYLSKDGEEGYPGNLNVTVTYELTEQDEFKITYKAITDQDTYVNMTHHSYFNLQGAGAGTTIDHHILQINASYFTPTDESLIPNGDITSVENTPLDFRKPAQISKKAKDDYLHFKLTNGYDHNYVLDKEALKQAAMILDPVSGRMMKVITTEPGMQFYSCNSISKNDIGKHGQPYPDRGAFCLEAQHHPNSPNEERFPSTLLRPGEVYHSTCIYQFGIAPK